ncbi:hypothetical protein SAMN06893096_104295 [Geodermatophilus pulveris]|uniref:Uncharacterized protein n=1 Tax=Geodermatophilus pulveris TaxID=1564159 RepID=A0A239EUH5_9ACTN|nr:hypothetical protein [Geodermatophilus pulveris]SNS47928.1 hypothetical protein SAMN06893096_104295 [Geodermatophilus pulveris]
MAPVGSAVPVALAVVALAGALGLGAVTGQQLVLLVGPAGCLAPATRRPVRAWTRPARATPAADRGRSTQRTG